MKIRPTKRLILFAVLIIFAALPAALVNSAAGYLPILSLLFCVIISLVQTLAAHNCIEVGAYSVTGECYRGNEIDFSAEVKNKSILPIANMRMHYYVYNMSGNFSYDYEFYATMSPKQQRKFGFAVSFDHVGLYDAGVKTVEIFDIFGIFRVRFEPDNSCKIQVLPRKLRMDKLPSDTKMQTESSRAVTASAVSGSDYTGVREYVYGDPMKTIQWKLSAHSATLVTKLLESYTNTGITMVLNFAVPDFDDDVRSSLFDAILETSAAVGDYAHREGLDFEVMFQNSGIKHRFAPVSVNDYGQMLHRMRISPCSDKNSGCTTLLQEDCAGSYAQANIILCTSYINDEIIYSLISLKRMKKNPILFYFIPRGVYDDEKKELLSPLKALSFANVQYVVASDAQEVAQ